MLFGYDMSTLEMLEKANMVEISWEFVIALFFVGYLVGSITGVFFGISMTKIENATSTNEEGQ